MPTKWRYDLRISGSVFGQHLLNVHSFSLRIGNLFSQTVHIWIVKLLFIILSNIQIYKEFYSVHSRGSDLIINLEQNNYCKFRSSWELTVVISVPLDLHLVTFCIKNICCHVNILVCFLFGLLPVRCFKDKLVIYLPKSFPVLLGPLLKVTKYQMSRRHFIKLLGILPGQEIICPA